MKRPFWKDPFVLAFLAGAVLVTLAVPLFRKIAPPPEVTATLPAWSLADESGGAVTSLALRGRVVLVGLVSARAPEASRRVALALGELEPRFGTARADVVLLLLDLDARDDAARASWLLATAPALRGARVVAGDDACGLALAGFAPGTTTDAPPCDAAVALAREGRLLVVDAEGRARGTYGSVGEPLYEAFERTLRTCDLAR